MSVNELQKTVSEHQIILLNQGVPLEKTMMTEPAPGFACELDIIGSTQHNARSYFEHLKQRAFCLAYERINESYEINEDNPLQPFAKGYKLKELGDGFIFTTNYPFLLKSQESIADQTVELVRNILTSMDDSFKDNGVPVYCAVAVTYEHLKGFWTQGSKVYDIDQSGITRASRLGALRRGLIQNDKDGNYNDCHIILITEKVFEMLTDRAKEGFKAYSIDRLGIDTKGSFDGSEKVIYVKRIKNIEAKPIHLRRIMPPAS
jgi:hypothetical protein